MPLFEYECPMCGLHHEELMSYKMDKECPHCTGEILMTPLISVPGIAFKGDGWAKDGYAEKRIVKDLGDNAPAKLSERQLQPNGAERSSTTK